MYIKLQILALYCIFSCRIKQYDTLEPCLIYHQLHLPTLVQPSYVRVIVRSNRENCHVPAFYYIFEYNCGIIRLETNIVIYK